MKAFHFSIILGLIALTACSTPKQNVAAGRQDTSAGDRGGMRGMSGMGMGGSTMMAGMTAQMDSMMRMTPEQMSQMMPRHERMMSQMMDQMGAEMRQMNMSASLVHEVRQVQVPKDAVFIQVTPPIQAGQQ